MTKTFYFLPFYSQMIMYLAIRCGVFDWWDIFQFSWAGNTVWWLVSSCLDDSSQSLLKQKLTAQSKHASGDKSWRRGVPAQPKMWCEWKKFNLEGLCPPTIYCFLYLHKHMYCKFFKMFCVVNKLLMETFDWFHYRNCIYKNENTNLE